jgi:hypothetical protein
MVWIRSTFVPKQKLGDNRTGKHLSFQQRSLLVGQFGIPIEHPGHSNYLSVKFRKLHLGLITKHSTDAVRELRGTIH